VAAVAHALVEAVAAHEAVGAGVAAADVASANAITST